MNRFAKNISEGTFIVCSGIYCCTGFMTAFLVGSTNAFETYDRHWNDNYTLGRKASIHSFAIGKGCAFGIGAGIFWPILAARVAFKKYED